MPGQAYKQKSAFTGRHLPKVDNRSTSKMGGMKDVDKSVWSSMEPKLEFLPAHISPSGEPATEKLRALPSWLRALLAR